MIEDKIPAMKVKDLLQSPVSHEIPKLEKVKVDESTPPIDDKVGILRIILLWIKENLINDILISRSGVLMESKVWYASKTLWTNLIILVWQFIGPMVGVPTLSAEHMLIAIGIVNFILRLITKGSVTLS